MCQISMNGGNTVQVAADVRHGSTDPSENLRGRFRAALGAGSARAAVSNAATAQLPKFQHRFDTESNPRHMPAVSHRAHTKAASGSKGIPESPASKKSQQNKERSNPGPDTRRTNMNELATNATDATTANAVDGAGMEALTARANALFFQIMDLNMTFEEKTGGQKAAKNKSGQVAA